MDASSSSTRIRVSTAAADRSVTFEKMTWTEESIDLGYSPPSSPVARSPWGRSPRARSPTTAVDCVQEFVLYEGWVLKQSRWLGLWRWRWVVVTPAKLCSFSAERGHENSDPPTEEHAVRHELLGARILEGSESPTGGATPLSCVLVAHPGALAPPPSHAVVQVLLHCGATAGLRSGRRPGSG